MDDLRPASRAPFEHEGPMEPSASAAVRRFLTSHGVREHHHASEIARIIDVDRSQSYRRLKGDVAWTHADLRAVARHFGAKDDHLLAELEPRGRPPQADAFPAMVRIPALPSQGLLVPGAELRGDESADLVAVRSPNGWEIYADGDEPAGMRRHAIEALTLRSQPHLQVALLEDDKPTAQALTDAFRPLGIAVSSFHDRASLVCALPRRRFDAFVLDWRLGDGTAAPVIEAIRSSRPQVPVVVVTGALVDAETERTLYELSAQWNFSTLDKPVRPVNLANALKQLLAVGRNERTVSHARTSEAEFGPVSPRAPTRPDPDNPPMNPLLESLHPYPFERWRTLTRDIVPSARHAPISLGIGEPRHPSPALVKDAIVSHLGGLATYPATLGEPALRETIASWVLRRYGVALDPAAHILPVNGSREALFAIAQAVVDPTWRGRTEARAPVVVCPNPFYQIYEGAALLAGAETAFANSDPERNFAPDWSAIDEDTWSRTQLVYVCSPGNPTGAVMSLQEWKDLFALSDTHGFVIASDECYSEIWFGPESAPPLGALEAARQLGRTDFRRLVVFTSLSKRSNAPGLRSGFVAGDAELIRSFLLYRTYHGSAMSPVVQAASAAAWSDESHVRANRDAYRVKFAQVTPLLEGVLDVRLPDAGFYLWARIPPHLHGGNDVAFALGLLAQYNVTILPGSLLARTARGVNPGAGRVRLALVAGAAECLEAAHRIVAYTQSLS